MVHSSWPGCFVLEKAVVLMFGIPQSTAFSSPLLLHFKSRTEGIQMTEIAAVGNGGNVKLREDPATGRRVDF